MSFDTLESSTYLGEPYELYRVTSGTRVWQITSGDIERTHSLHGVFTPEVVDRTEIAQHQETNAGEIQVHLPLSSAIAQEFIATMPSAPYWITIFAGHDGDSEIITVFRGMVAKAVFGDECTLTVQPESSAVRKKVPGPVYQLACNRVLYSSGCGASMEENLWTVKVGSIAADGVTIGVDTGASESAVFVSYWASHWSSSLDADGPPSLAWGFAQTASGLRMMIGTHPSANTFVLKARIYGLAVGDVLTVYRGCRRSIKHCRHFGRLSRFMGFDKFPSKNPFNGVI